MNRDPIGEKIRFYKRRGSSTTTYDLADVEPNLFIAIANDTENKIDPDGRSIINPPTTYQAVCLAAVIVNALRTRTINGDWRHCYVTCQGNKFCGPITDISGLIYEILQLIGGIIGGDTDDLEMEIEEFLNDMRANVYGQACGRNYSSSCDCCCSRRYPR